MKKITFLSIISISFAAMHGMEDEKYPLHEAAKNGDVAEVGKLLTNGVVDVNTAREFGETALHVALRTGNTNMIRLLIEHKADVNAEYGFSRLKETSIPILLNHCQNWTHINNIIPMLTLLIDNGANPNYRNLINQGTIFHDLSNWKNIHADKYNDIINQWFGHFF